jgi:hypothetical protein
MHSLMLQLPAENWQYICGYLECRLVLASKTRIFNILYSLGNQSILVGQPTNIGWSTNQHWLVNQPILAGQPTNTVIY